MFYERKLLKELRRWVDKKAIIVVTGMRRVGKTTLFKMLFEEIESKNKVFLDIENPIVQKLFDEKDYNNIFLNLENYSITKSERAYIFLDEIQAMPEIIRPIKYLYDHYNIQFFLTGSSSFYLKNLFPESLAGRKIVFELFPLDFEEFLFFKGKTKKFYIPFREKEKKKNEVLYEITIKFYEEYIKYGGFPQVVLATTIEEKKAFLDDIFKSYFEKDIKSLSDFKNLNILRDFILLLMQRAGSKLHIDKISSELGVTRQTVYSYLSFLEATYFINLISPFTRSKDREVSGTKKVYICDTGILNNLSQVSFGVLLENSVFNTIKKLDKVNYYQRRSGIEIDFIFKKQKIALEVKETGTKKDKDLLARVSKDLKIKENYVITKKFNKEKGFIPITEL